MKKKTDFCSLKQIGIVSVPDPVVVAQIEQEIWVQFFFFFLKKRTGPRFEKKLKCQKHQLYLRYK
jgi:hypothetical protein